MPVARVDLGTACMRSGHAATDRATTPGCDFLECGYIGWWLMIKAPLGCSQCVLIFVLVRKRVCGILLCYSLGRPFTINWISSCSLVIFLYLTFPYHMIIKNGITAHSVDHMLSLYFDYL